MKKIEKKKRFKKKSLFLVIVGILLIVWAVRVITLTRKWDRYFPTVDVVWTDAIHQRGLDIRMVEYTHSGLEEVEERFGQVDRKQAEMYPEFDPQNHYAFYVVTFELENATEEEHSYPMFDVLMAGDVWVAIPCYPYIFVCNGEDEERIARQSPRPGETTRYSMVYALPDWAEPLYIEFAHDGALIRLNIPEGKEVIDGKTVEA